MKKSVRSQDENFGMGWRRRFFGVVGLVWVLIFLWGGVGYGNEKKGNCDNSNSKTPTTQSGAQSGDPVVIAAGNEYRNVVDLEMWAGVGDHRLGWVRSAFSRVGVSSATPFGTAHIWRHGYQWEMAEAFVAADGARQMRVSYPDGDSVLFREGGVEAWVAPVAVGDRLTRSGPDFYLVRADGYRYHFVRREKDNGSEYYLMEDFLDPYDNAYDLEYDGAGRLVRVGEPGGRWLKVRYASLPVNRVEFADLYQVRSEPGEGWTEVEVKGGKSYRFLRYLSADGGHCEVGEVEFYEYGTGARITGRVIGSEAGEEGAEAACAFDGDVGSGFRSGAETGAFVGLDLGEGNAKRVGKIRFYPKAGKAAAMWNKGFGTWGRFQGANEKPASVAVIAGVESSDGRRVEYVYGKYEDEVLPFVYQALVEVAYFVGGEEVGERAELSYTQVWPGTRPLVESYYEPRYTERMPYGKAVYAGEDSSVFGQVRQQINPETGEVMLTIGTIHDAHQPTVWYPWGHMEHYVGNGSQPKRMTDEMGRVTRWSYDERTGYRIEEVDAMGRVMRWENSERGNPVAVIYPDGSVERWTRDGLDSIVSHTDTLGRTTVYERDDHHRVRRVVYPDGLAEEFSYNGFGQVATHRWRNGGTEVFSYDARGLLVERRDAEGGSVRYGYDGMDRLVEVTDGLGRTTRMVYDGRGLVTEVVNPDGTARSFGYDAEGNRVRETDELGATWVYEVDLFRRVTAVTDPLGRTGRTVYRTDSYGREPLETVTPGGKRTVFSYDTALRRTAVTEGAGGADATTARFVYDRGDRLVEVEDGSGRKVAFAYDLLDRKVGVVDALGNRTRWSYDAAGNEVSVTRADGGVSTRSYDAMNRPVSVTDEKGQTTRFEYDAAGNLAGMVDARGSVYRNRYDLVGRKTEMVYPDGTAERYGYDLVGNLEVYTTRAGQEQRHSYDSRNRPVFSDWSDGTPDIARSYDGAGRLVVLDNGVAEITHSYDEANQLVEETTRVGGGGALTVSYRYNADGLPEWVGYPSGEELAVGYTGRNQVAGIASLGSGGSGGGVEVVSYRYDGAGNRIGKRLGNGTESEYGYDGAGRLTGLEHRRGGGGGIVSFGYELDRVGNRVGKSEGGVGEERYRYDATDQLVGVRYGDGRSVDYAYDAAGNRTGVTEGGRTESYAANAVNQYIALRDGAGLLEIPVYDGNGNLVSLRGNGYRYDAQNRLVGAVVGGVETRFAYDGKNRCISRVAQPSGQEGQGEGSVERLVYDGWNLIEERDGEGNLLRKYVHGAGVDEVVSKTDGMGTQWYDQDGLGSVVALTDGAGNVVESYRYDVGGKAHFFGADGGLLEGSAEGNRFLFTGREWLKEAGIYDYRNRVYSAELGRFLQTDPVGFGGGDGNIYRYCGNNGVNWVDPMGLNKSKSGEGGGANPVAPNNPPPSPPPDPSPRSPEPAPPPPPSPPSPKRDRKGGGSVTIVIDVMPMLFAISDFSAGVGDALTFGITNSVREAAGYNDIVDHSSGAYFTGEVAGTGLQVAVGGSLSLRVGAEISMANRGNAVGKWLSQGKAWRLGASGAKQTPTLRIGAARPPTPLNHIDLTFFGY